MFIVQLDRCTGANCQKADPFCLVVVVFCVVLVVCFLDWSGGKRY